MSAVVSKRERDPLKRSMVTCFEDQFGSVELYKGSWETRELVADEEPGAGADKGLWVGRAGWAWSSGLSLEEVSDRVAERHQLVAQAYQGHAHDKLQPKLFLLLK